MRELVPDAEGSMSNVPLIPGIHHIGVRWNVFPSGCAKTRRVENSQSTPFPELITNCGVTLVLPIGSIREVRVRILRVHTCFARQAGLSQSVGGANCRATEWHQHSMTGSYYYTQSVWH